MEPEPNTTAAQTPVPGGPTPVLRTVKVNDREYQVTQEELERGYGLTRAANERMEQAANLRKAAETDVQTAEAVRQLLTKGDASAGQRLMELVGLPAEQVAQFTQLLREAQAEAGGSGAVGNSSAGQEPEEFQPIQLNELSPDLQEKIRMLDNLLTKDTRHTRDTTRQEMFHEAEIFVDKDAVLGTIQDVSVKASAKEYFRNEVERRVGLHGEAWPDVLQDIVLQARTIFGRGGNQGSGARGTGQAGIAIGPSAVMASGPQANEPLKAVPTTSPDYRKNFAQRLVQKMQQLGNK